MTRKCRIVDSGCRTEVDFPINCKLFGMAGIQRSAGMAAKSGLDSERPFTSC